MTVLAGILLLAFVLLFLLLTPERGEKPDPEEQTRDILEQIEPSQPEPETEDSSPQDTEPPETMAPETPPDSERSTEPEEPYVSPIDFAALQAGNPDIYGWLQIPGTEISYPVLQSPEDDAYYLDHDSDGNWSREGAIFTEHTYNGTAFTDPATVVYGHRRDSGTMFGQLQSIYSDPEKMTACSEVIVFLPERELHYQVFAAVPYDNRHILYHYDFGSRRMYNAFLETIWSVREIGAVLDTSVTVSSEDPLLILSTCLRGNAQKRFLVLAKLTRVTPEIETETN